MCIRLQLQNAFIAILLNGLTQTKVPQMNDWQVTSCKPAYWQVRVFYDENTVTPGWSEWELIKPRHTESVAERLKEYQDIIVSGNKNYELRALYLSTADAQEDESRRMRELMKNPTKLNGKVKAGPSF